MRGGTMIGDHDRWGTMGGGNHDRWGTMRGGTMRGGHERWGGGHERWGTIGGGYILMLVLEPRPYYIFSETNGQASLAISNTL